MGTRLCVLILAAMLCSCVPRALAQERESAPQQTIKVEKPGVMVNATGMDKEYAEALAAILSEARRGYENTLGLSLPDTVTLDARIDPGARVRLWTDGESRLFLTLTSKDDLGPASETGIFNIYGMCHELGHIAMYRKMKSLSGLPEGVGEGWAHYAGSVVVDAAAARLGANIWPESYDVAAAEGLARLEKQIVGHDWSELDAVSKAAKVFYEVEKTYSRKVVGSAMNAALSRQPTGRDLMPFFVEALRTTTGDGAAGDWIPQDLLESQVKWSVKERHPGEDFFADMKALMDPDGVLLYYDDGTSEGVLSSAGSGHAVLFQAPEGQWKLDKIEVFGSRYGTSEAPDEDFRVYVCDEEFVPFAEFGRPYGLFERGDNRWVEIKLEPVAVAGRFYVCLDFNPTYTKGVYVAYDEGAKRSHSRSALPESHVSDVQKAYDWMIRAHLARNGGTEDTPQAR